MATYYISTSGNDTTGNGTLSFPWRTLVKATTAVTTPGDIIHINAGTYIETTTCNLAVGVNIEGDGITSIVKSTITADFTPIIRCSSAIGTNGNQHISDIKIDGTLTAKWGILVEGRSNFSIHDITMVDVFSAGIIIDGGINAGEASTYATGNTFYNNIINNCAEYAGGYARGCLNIGSQDGMLIYNNQITQDQRAVGFNGEPIKYWNGGFLKGVQIYNNTLKKKALAAGAGVSDWDFNIEFFMISGLNIYGNTFINGAIDLAGMFKGTYSYGVWIHNNTFYSEVLNVYRQSGIIIEVLIQDVLIEDNIIYNFSNGVYMTPRIYDFGIPLPGADTKNITIRRNLMILNTATSTFTDLGGRFIDFGGGDFQQFQDCYIYNNTCLYPSGLEQYVAVGLPQATSGFIKNIYIKNNIFSGSNYGVIYQEPTSTVVMDNLQITNNSFYGSTGSDYLFLGSGSGTNYVNSSNSHTNPTYVGSGNYTLQSSSPLIDAGVNIGLTYYGSAPDIGYAEFNSGNISPVASAGVDQTITLPTSSIALAGSGTDSDGTIASHVWSQISGPNTATITTSTSYTSTVTSLIAGTYVLRLTVTDNLGATGIDDIQIIVNPVPVIQSTIKRRIIIL